MTPRDEHVEEYTPKTWTRSYNGFSGVDFALERNDKVHPGMEIQAISYSSTHRGQLCFLNTDGNATQGDKCNILLSACNEQGKRLVMYVIGVTLLDPVVSDALVAFSYESVTEWNKP